MLGELAKLVFNSSATAGVSLGDLVHSSRSMLPHKDVIALVLCTTAPLAIGSICVVAYQVARNTDARTWTSTTATVTSIEIVPKRAKLTYDYDYGGVAYSNDRFAFLSAGSIPDRDQILDEYAVGQTITIRVNPADPQDSVVLCRPVRISYIWQWLFLPAFIAVVVMFNWVRMQVDRRSTES